MLDLNLARAAKRSFCVGRGQTGEWGRTAVRAGEVGGGGRRGEGCGAGAHLLHHGVQGHGREAELTQHHTQDLAGPGGGKGVSVLRLAFPPRPPLPPPDRQGWGCRLLPASASAISRAPPGPN
jgi:hypothetical protein